TLGLTGTAAVLTPSGPLGMAPQVGGSMMAGDPGMRMGPMMAGAAPRYVPEGQARAFGGQIPPGATVDRTNKRITFQSADVHLKVLGSPEGNPEMTFLIAGLSNPSITVPRGARVEVEV